MKNIRIIILICCTISLNVQAQTDYQISNYMNNQLFYNPAYAGVNKDLNISLLGRSQWFGLPNSPQSFALNAHTVVPSIGGIGLSASRDKLGGEINTAAKISYAYTFKIADSTKLSFGLSAGITSRSIDMEHLVFETNEPLVQNGLLETKIKPDFGFGARFMWKNLDVQLSALHISNRYDAYDYNNIPRHYYAIAAYNFRLSKQFMLTPSLLFKSNGSFHKVDINVRGLFQNRFLVGFGYRLEEAILATVGMKITDNFAFVYSYDFVSGPTNILSKSNHEITLIGKFDIFNKKLNKPNISSF